ncbi:MAG: ABC transporter substrate-binding protein [Christensenellales bacterium]
MKQRKLVVALAVILVLVLAIGVLTACKKEEKIPYEAIDDNDIVKDLTYGVDYKTLYDQFGNEADASKLTFKSNGLAYQTFSDGKEYELGLDFLSMAMVYKSKNEGEYVKWWKAFIQRWNYLLPEVPLYSNQYYDVFDARVIDKESVIKNPTNPYWSVANALIDWKATAGNADKKIIIGNTTELSGNLRHSTFGVSSPAASDLDIDGLINGYSTVVANKVGDYQYDNTVVESHEDKVNEDGTRTFTVKIKNDLKFSDGTPITAKNFLYYLMAFSTPITATKEGGGSNTAGQSYVGYKEYSQFDGTNDGKIIYKKDKDGKDTTDVDYTISKKFKGVRLIDEYTYSLTATEDYATYFYGIALAGLSPTAKAMYMGNNDVKDDGDGCYIVEAENAADKFYNTKTEGEVTSYTFASYIRKSASNTNQAGEAKIPFTGAYMIDNYDKANKTCTLVRNDQYKGNFEGQKGGFDKIVYIQIVSETQLTQLEQGQVNVVAGITGGTDTDAALKLVREKPDSFASVDYARAGYGKLGFRSDFGPAMFQEVRQAIAYSIDRPAFAKQFNGGYGGVVDGPYYTGAWMYKEALKEGMKLDVYTASVDSAIEVLEDGGWTYNYKGEKYKAGDGIRYKKLSGAELTYNNLHFASQDGKYKTYKLGGAYYMPLVINWFGTTPNPFTDQLISSWATSSALQQIGMAVQYKLGDFTPMLGELYQYEGYGYNGVATYNAFNFATGYNSAAYDYSFNCSIEPNLFENNSQWYIKDAADYYYISK